MAGVVLVTNTVTAVAALAAAGMETLTTAGLAQVNDGVSAYATMALVFPVKMILHGAAAERHAINLHIIELAAKRVARESRRLAGSGHPE